MKTTQNGKDYTITEGQDGVLTLTPLIKQRVPEETEVWSCEGDTFVFDQKGGTTVLNSSHFEPGNHQEDFRVTGEEVYLGKFPDVFVKISDVVKALSIEDEDEDSLLNWLSTEDDIPGYIPNYQTRDRTRDALAQLNIK